MKETIAYLNSLIKENDTIVIGLSGGPDSMCLLDIILKLNKKIKIVCAHINHNIREESSKELEFVKEYCQNKKVTLELTTFPKKSETSSYNEQQLREKRYQYFEKVIEKYHAKYLFTAHHGDDLIETILMRISRGSNLKGYAGFRVENQKIGYKIIKPLIYMTKDEINNYNQEKNIPYVTDNSNEEDNYTRNRYRHHILPFLKKESPNIHLKYLKFSKELDKYYNYVDKEIKNILDKRYKNNILDITNFNTLDDLIQSKIIESILDDNYIDNLYLVSDKHIDLILNIIKNPKPNIEINLPDNLKITKSYNELKITRKKETKEEYYLKLEAKTELPNGHRIEIITETEEKSNYYLKLNSQEIKLPLYVRTRKNGDKMTIKNMINEKKIKDIFIDSKLSKSQRDTQPIVVDSNGTIIWLPGLKKSKFDKANNELYDIILRYN